MKNPKMFPLWAATFLQQAIWYLWFSDLLFRAPWQSLVERSTGTHHPGIIFFLLSVTASMLMARMTSWLFLRLDIQSAGKGALMGSLLWTAFQGPALAAFALFLQLPNTAILIMASEGLLAFSAAGALLAAWPAETT